MISDLFSLTAGLAPKSVKGPSEKSKTHIFPMDFDDFVKNRCPKKSSMCKNHVFLYGFQPSEGSENPANRADF